MGKIAEAQSGDIIPFKIDDIEFDIVTTGTEGTWEDDARPMPFPIEVTERYEVVVQPVPGYKSITQAVEPVALKELHFTVTTFTKEDKEVMDGLNNYKPHEVQCHLLEESPLLMYILSKVRSVPDTGMQQFAITWDVTMREVNDNNAA
ncbi:MAG: hypothetical protein WCW68_01620 [Methanothrix sp.]